MGFRHALGVFNETWFSRIAAAIVLICVLSMIHLFIVARKTYEERHRCLAAAENADQRAECRIDPRRTWNVKKKTFTYQ